MPHCGVVVVEVEGSSKEEDKLEGGGADGRDVGV